MSACTFFGHRDCTEAVYPELYKTILDLIINHNVDTFLVGNQGAFDRMAKKALQDISAEYTFLQYATVLAYMPVKKPADDLSDWKNTILPEKIESVPARFAISYRNDWLISQSDYVITCVSHPFGGAARFAEKARKRGKIIINISASADQYL